MGKRRGKGASVGKETPQGKGRSMRSRHGMSHVRVVRAKFDAEARVWVAESDDVPGLVTEADTYPELFAKLQVMILELIELNEGPDGEAPVELITRMPQRDRCAA